MNFGNYELFSPINTSATGEIYAQGEDVRLIQDCESCEQSSLN